MAAEPDGTEISVNRTVHHRDVTWLLYQPKKLILEHTVYIKLSKVSSYQRESVRVWNQTSPLALPREAGRAVRNGQTALRNTDGHHNTSLASTRENSSLLLQPRASIFIAPGCAMLTLKPQRELR